MHQCKLPIDYYFNRLEDYCFGRDPLSKFYKPDESRYVRRKKLVDKVENLQVSEQIATVESKSLLIREALDIARRSNIKAPYFKSMDVEKIQLFIDKYKRTLD